MTKLNAGFEEAWTYIVSLLSVVPGFTGVWLNILIIWNTVIMFILLTSMSLWFILPALWLVVTFWMLVVYVRLKREEDEWK